MIYTLIKKLKKPTSNEAPALTQCVHRSEPLLGLCPECKTEKSAMRRYRWQIILCLVWPYALQALDSTIIASALPWIASDFHKVSQQNWIISAFNLTSAAFIPCWAQLADIFGRYATLTGAIGFMLLGSALCTASPTSAFPMLLLGRGFQGLAAAGLNVLVRTILADRVSLQDSAKNWAIFAFVGGIAYALGPVAGGYLTGSNWRWCFGINLPIAGLALVITFVFLRKELLGPQPIPELDETNETGRRTKLIARLKTVDFGGQILFLLGFGLIILGLTWGGATYSWGSAPVLVPLIIGGLLAGSFLAWERQLAPGRSLSRKLPWQRAMIPWSLLTNRDIGIIFYTECVTGMSMYAVLYFCNIYFIAVKNYNSDKAGLQLLYFTPGIGVGVYTCAFLCNKWPRMTFPPLLFGTIIEGTGIGVLACALYRESSATIFGMMAMVGAGMGIRFMVAPLHGIGIFRQHRAAVIGLMAVAIPFGGTIGLTVMSTVFNNTSGLNSYHGDFSKIRDLPSDAQTKAIHDAKMGVVWAFVAIVPFVVLAWILTLFLGNVHLDNKDAAETDDEGNQYTVTNEIFLLSFFKKSRSTTVKEIYPKDSAPKTIPINDQSSQV
ncbi:MFS-type transporter ucsD [Cladobotryum mycophilum]|uniref:MFS-type transporter ucsD n=1 Tax=Cladobotryum mycophilum TaxID=491253 RepID=A0ABR0T0T0_9HYPO